MSRSHTTRSPRPCDESRSPGEAWLLADPDCVALCRVAVRVAGHVMPHEQCHQTVEPKSLPPWSDEHFHAHVRASDVGSPPFRVNI